ncbi:hypothetical protein BDN67DRAFT_985842 [Paxillus ammoniavirescens]|nr:hypothetical protein BDN67DRAFT_985842 [Paxillus ammoniavirescens]
MEQELHFDSPAYLSTLADLLTSHLTGPQDGTVPYLAEFDADAVIGKAFLTEDAYIASGEGSQESLLEDLHGTLSTDVTCAASPEGGIHEDHIEDLTGVTTPSTYLIRDTLACQYPAPLAEVVNLNIVDLLCNKGAYTSCCQLQENSVVHFLQKVLGLLDLEVGKKANQNGFIFAVLAGCPVNDHSWDPACDEATKVMLKVAETLGPVQSNQSGSYEPMNLSNLNSKEKSIQKIAGFISTHPDALAFYVPKLCVHLVDTLDTKNFDYKASGRRVFSELN